MEDALSRIAALAPKLREAQLRVILELTRHADEQGNCQRSFSQIRAATGMVQSSLWGAIHSLIDLAFITADAFRASHTTTYHLSFLEVAVLTVPGSFAEPPKTNQLVLSENQVVLLQNQGSGSFGEPGGSFAEPLTNRERARVAPRSESDSDYNQRIRATSDLFERIAKAKPESYDSDEIRTVREALCGYWRRMKEEPDAHPPPDKLCAEMLAIASRRRILQLIDELWRNRQKPDRSYRWFVTVALNRIHHLEPAHIGKGFAQLRILEKHVPDPEQRALLPENDKERMLALHEAVKRAAAGKAFR